MISTANTAARSRTSNRWLVILLVLNAITSVASWTIFILLWRQQSDWWRIDRSNLLTRIGVLEQRLEDLKEKGE